MKYVRLGKTELLVSRTSFGALPIQRIEQREVTRILHHAFDAGINFYDTARAYSNSEEKLGVALSDRREKIIIASKSGATSKDGLLADLETSLKNLKTDYIDILQLHNPSDVDHFDDPDSAYAGLEIARQKGMIRFKGITCHSRDNAKKAIASAKFATMQFPLCMISTPEDMEVAELSRQADMGVIAMKAMSGGILTNAKAAFAFLRQFEHIVPIWGVQRLHELEEFLEYEENEPVLDAELQAVIDKDRQELAADFCRACGYCLPCPANIPIPMAARMALCLRRMPYERFLSEDWQEKMGRIDDCIDCGACKKRCPYGLDTPNLLKKMKVDYDLFLQAHTQA